MHLAETASGHTGSACGGGAMGIASGPSSLASDAAADAHCRFPKLEECAHFHYERVQLPTPIAVSLQPNMERSLHSQHSQEVDDCEWYMVQVASGEECWLLQRNAENFRLLDSQLHQCIYDRKHSQLPDLTRRLPPDAHGGDVEALLGAYLQRFTAIADNSINCGPVLNWLQMDNKGHRLLVPSEESRSINTPAVAAAYSVRRYVSQARDELNLEVGDMISVIDMASPGESIWWRGKRGFQVGFFPQHCVHIIGDKVPRNMPLPAPVVGSLALSPIKPVLRKHGKLIAFFRSFILNRPSRRRLKQSGILRERVFGCDLGEHLLNSGCDIPTVLKCCAEFIETHGIVDGIYRLSGVTSNIQKLRNAFDEDRIPNLYTEDILQDIHSVASLLKMYFRELPNPLCTYQLYQSFVQAVQGCTATLRNAAADHERLLRMREAVQKLPPPHYRTLEHLAKHLARVAAHGARTGMTVRNVAIVWAPNLLRCAELEVGGVAALQGVGVQAVVTEFLICYADLIFCDNLNATLQQHAEAASNGSHMAAAMLLSSAAAAASSPKRSRPKSLAISTPTKLITLEEARSKHNHHSLHKEAYIEVGGGPDSLPKKYHTIIELPQRKRLPNKRSPLGWRSLFGRSSRSSRTGSKPTIVHHVPCDKVDACAGASVMAVKQTPEVKIVLRTVKSAESLSDLDQLPPLQNVLASKPAGHNRSVSHDSYFDTLQSSQEGSLLDLSEIQVNFDLEESEMRIFSEDESLVSSPRVQPRRVRIASGNNSGNPSPKKQPRVVPSPEAAAASRKRTRLEEQLSDIQFIDCNTPEMGCPATGCETSASGGGGPRNKSPRNSQCRLSQMLMASPQSPTPQTPTYKLLESSTGTTPGDISPSHQPYGNLNKVIAVPKSPTYENVLTTISITYKSPTKTTPPTTTTKGFCDAAAGLVPEGEHAQIPTSAASLPLQEAQTTTTVMNVRHSSTSIANSMSTIDDLPADAEELLARQQEVVDVDVHHADVATDTLLCDDVEDELPLSLRLNNDEDDSFPKCDTTLSELIDSYDRIAKATSGDWSGQELVEGEEEDEEEGEGFKGEEEVDHQVEGEEEVEPEEMHDYENVKTISLSEEGERDDTTADYENINFDSSGGLLTAPIQDLIEFSPVAENPTDPPMPEDDGERVEESSMEVSLEEEGGEKRKAEPRDAVDHDQVYQQVKYFRRSVHEINALLLTDDAMLQEAGAEGDIYEDVNGTPKHEEEEEEEEEEEDVAKVLEIIEPISGAESPHPIQEPETTYDSLEGHDYEPIDFTNDSLEDTSSSTSTTSSISPKPAAEIKVQLRSDDISMTFTMSSTSTSMSMSTSTNTPPSLPSKDGADAVDSNSTSAPPPAKSSVKHLTSKFEGGATSAPLPPCVRARNLKASRKTMARSLDESEFRQRTMPQPSPPPMSDNSNMVRRKSFDESMTAPVTPTPSAAGYKTNTLPKTLNKPKQLPDDPELQAHVVPHDTSASSAAGSQLNRERIEKYKEERRRYLHDKYRSESFKENKDVLLSRLKVFKKEEEVSATTTPLSSLEVVEVVQVVDVPKTTPTASPSPNGVKARTAIFESENASGQATPTPIAEVELRPGSVSSRRKVFTVPPVSGGGGGFVDRRSFDSAPPSSGNARKETTTYCTSIKDMKAIFESKSQQ